MGGMPNGQRAHVTKRPFSLSCKVERNVAPSPVPRLRFDLAATKPNCYFIVILDIKGHLLITVSIFSAAFTTGKLTCPRPTRALTLR